MKATILNGALPDDSFVDAAGAALQEALRAEGWAVTLLHAARRKDRLLPGLFRVLDQNPRRLPH